MHVDHVARSRAFVQIVDVLRHQQHIADKFALQPGQRAMCGVRFHTCQRRAPRIVEAQHQVRIARERFGRSDVLHPVPLPQATGGAERIDPAFGRHPRPGQDHDIAVANLTMSLLS